MNESIVSPEMRNNAAGKYSLELIRAAALDAFPDGHFAIPQEARAATPGSRKSSKN